jgi:hypothetical protein
MEELADQSPSGRGTSWVTPHRYPRLEDNSNCPRWTGHIWTHREQGVVAVIQRVPAEEQMQVKELLEQLDEGVLDGSYGRSMGLRVLPYFRSHRPRC